MAPDSTASEPAPDERRRRRALLRWSAVAAASGYGAGLFWPHDETPSRPVAMPGFSTLNGQAVRIDTAGQRGLLVCFWATSCAICVQDLPALSRLLDQWSPRGIAVVAVAMAYDREEMVRHVARMNPGAPPIALDTHGEIAAALGPIRDTPTHCLLDRQGRVLLRHRGRLDPTTLAPRLRALTERT